MKLGPILNFICGVALSIVAASLPLMIERGVVADQTWLLMAASGLATVGGLQVSQAFVALTEQSKARKLLESEIGTNTLLLNTARQHLESLMRAIKSNRCSQDTIEITLQNLTQSLETLDQAIRLVGKPKTVSELQISDATNILPTFEFSGEEVEDSLETVRDMRLSGDPSQSLDPAALERVQSLLERFSHKLESSEQRPAQRLGESPARARAPERVNCTFCNTSNSVDIPDNPGETRHVRCSSCHQTFLVHRSSGGPLITSMQNQSGQTKTAQTYEELLRNQQFPLPDPALVHAGLTSLVRAFETAPDGQIETWPELDAGIESQLRTTGLAYESSDITKIRKIAYKCQLFRFLTDKKGFTLKDGVNADTIHQLVFMNIVRRIQSGFSDPIDTRKIARFVTGEPALVERLAGQNTQPAAPQLEIVSSASTPPE